MKVAIFAVDKQFNFGNNDGTLPWGTPIKADMEAFKALTLREHNVVMGVNTFKSLKSKLKGRFNVVIVRPNSDLNAVRAKDGSRPDLMIGKADTQTFHAVDKKLEQFKITSYAVIGGKALLEGALHSGILQEIYETVVQGEYPADITLNVPKTGYVVDKAILSKGQNAPDILFCKFVKQKEEM